MVVAGVVLFVLDLEPVSAGESVGQVHRVAGAGVSVLDPQFPGHSASRVPPTSGVQFTNFQSNWGFHGTPPGELGMRAIGW